MSMVKRLTVLVVTAIIILLYSIIFLVNDKFSLSVDITENQLYEISSVTEDIVSSLESELLNITVFSQYDDYIFVLREMLKRYDQFEHVKVSYVDPYNNPLVVNSLRQQGFSIGEGDIVISSGSRVKHLQVKDLFLFDESGEVVIGIQAESAITNALFSVDNDTSIAVLFTEGHNERPSNGLISLFEQNNATVSRASLAVTDLSEEIDLVIIASPTRDISVDEELMINRYLQKGGSVMVFLEPTINPLENLEHLINAWGIGSYNNVVFEKSAYIANNPINVIPMYYKHEMNTMFNDNAYFVIMPSTMALYPVENYALSIKPVLLSSSTSYAKESLLFDTSIYSEQDESGPFLLAMTSQLELQGGDEARVFVSGSRKIYSDDLLEVQNYGNRDFISQAINWLVETDTVVSIHSKSMQPQTFVVFPWQQRLWTIVCTIIIPVSILFVGLIVYLRRRKL